MVVNSFFVFFLLYKSSGLSCFEQCCGPYIFITKNRKITHIYNNENKHYFHFKSSNKTIISVCNWCRADERIAPSREVPMTKEMITNVTRFQVCVNDYQKTLLIVRGNEKLSCKLLLLLLLFSYLTL